MNMADLLEQSENTTQESSTADSSSEKGLFFVVSFMEHQRNTVFVGIVAVGNVGAAKRKRLSKKRRRRRQQSTSSCKSSSASENSFGPDEPATAIQLPGASGCTFFLIFLTKPN